MKNIGIKVYFIINKDADIYFSVLFFFHFFLTFVLLSRSVMSDSLQPHGLFPIRFLCPWGFSRQEYWSRLPCPSPGSSQPRDWTEVSCTARGFFASWATREAQAFTGECLIFYSFFCLFVNLFFFSSRKTIVIFKQSDTLKFAVIFNKFKFCGYNHSGGTCYYFWKYLLPLLSD